MAAAAWQMLSFSSCIVCGFDSYTVLFKCSQEIFLSLPFGGGGGRTLLHRVYLKMIRRAQLCIDARGIHFQHLRWWYCLSAFGYSINFCIYAMLRTRATFSWPMLCYILLKTLEDPVKSRQSSHWVRRGQSCKGGSAFTGYFRPPPLIDSHWQYSQYAHLLSSLMKCSIDPTSERDSIRSFALRDFRSQKL